MPIGNSRKVGSCVFLFEPPLEPGRKNFPGEGAYKNTPVFEGKSTWAKVEEGRSEKRGRQNSIKRPESPGLGQAAVIRGGQ